MKNYVCKKCGKTFQYHREKKLCKECEPKRAIYLSIEERKKARKQQNIDGVNRRRIRIKQNMLQFCGEKCCICGYNKCDRSLTFHHVNPNEKVLGIASHMTNASWERIKNELKKCILVCSNCHNEIHAGLYDESFIKQKYSEVQKILNDNIIKEDIEKKNILEQKEKNERIEKEKQKFSRRKVIRPSYEQFKKEFKELNGNYCAMGRKYGVSDNTIRNWIKNYEKNIT